MSEDAIKSGNFTQCQSKEVLRNAKNERNVGDSLEKDAFTELIVVQEMLRDEDDEKKSIRGYVQEIGYLPFTCVMYKEESLVVTKNAISAGKPFYFDATGTVVAKTNHSRTILYYTMVVKGNTRGQPPVPVLEFLTDNQGTYTIVKPLLSFISALQKLCEIQIRPTRIECDFSWAIIHSILSSFNKMSVEEYLRHSYSVIRRTMIRHAINNSLLYSYAARIC